MGSLLLSFFAVYASVIGIGILRHWDLSSGSERQLALERKTYLISTVLAYLMAFELFSLFLFIYTADAIHTLFVGAMCAAGSLNVGSYGYSVLLVKIINVVLCGAWLVVNHVDNQAQDYPLIRAKYKLLIVLTALLVLETFLLIGYFGGLRADVITSCCGTLFSQSRQSITNELAGIGSYTAKIILLVSFFFLVRFGFRFLWTRESARLFSSLSVWFFVFALVAVVSFISLYFYEMPTHHCPFCVLQKDYHYIGYAMYFVLLSGVIAGLSLGILQRYSRVPSLAAILPRVQLRLCTTSLVSYALFLGIALYPMLFSNFRLEGY